MGCVVILLSRGDWKSEGQHAIIVIVFFDCSALFVAALVLCSRPGGPPARALLCLRLLLVARFSVPELLLLFTCFQARNVSLAFLSPGLAVGLAIRGGLASEPGDPSFVSLAIPQREHGLQPGHHIVRAVRRVAVL